MAVVKERTAFGRPGVASVVTRVPMEVVVLVDKSVAELAEADRVAAA